MSWSFSFRLGLIWPAGCFLSLFAMAFSCCSFHFFTFDLHSALLSFTAHFSLFPLSPFLSFPLLCASLQDPSFPNW
jgi:hypothetical protein